MATPDVDKAEVVASEPGWVPVMGVAKAASRATLGMAKVEVVASKSRWVPGAGRMQTAHTVVAPETWPPMRNLRLRRGPSREESH